MNRQTTAGTELSEVVEELLAGRQQQGASAGHGIRLRG
jgi:hypothetical protein